MVTNSTQDRCATPQMANPSGAPPNFVHRQMFRPITIASTIPFMALAIIFVGLKVFGTIRKERRLFKDDYMCLVALTIAVPFGVLEIMIATGYTHAWNMSHCEIDKIQTHATSAAGMLLYLPTLCAAKAFICALYLRLFESIQWMQRATWTILVWYTLSCTAGFILYLTHFILVKFNDAEAGPIDLRPYIILQTSETVLIDTLLLALPIRPIMGMQTLSLRKRFSLLLVFLAGSGATICTIILLIYSRQYYYPANPMAMLDQDWTWSVGIMNILVSIEIYMTIILGCVPGVLSTWRNVLRNTWFGYRLRSMFGISGEKHIHMKEMDKDLESGEASPDESLKVRNNDRTLKLETI